MNEDNDPDGNPIEGPFKTTTTESCLSSLTADRAARAREVALRAIETAEAECARVAKQRDELVKACSAKDDLLVCYRVGKRPSEKLFKRLDKAKRVLDAIAAEQPKPAGGA